MSEWSLTPISEMGRVVTGKTPPKKQLEYFDGDHPFVSPKDLNWDSLFIADTQTKVSQRALDKFKNQVIPPNTVMYTCLSFAFGKIGLAQRESLTNQQINSVIVNDNHDFRFVYYLLRANRPLIFSFNSGIDTPIVPKSVFESIRIPCPPLPIQKKIAAVLSAYDDLIVNNNRRIALLERTAEEIYREWFVRLRFPGWKTAKFEKGVPVGWQVLGLDKMGQYLNGYAFKPDDWFQEGLPIIKIRELRQGISDSTPRNPGSEIDKKYLIHRNDIVFSWSATLMVKLWDEEPGLLNQHLFKVTPFDNIPRSYLFFVLQDSIVKFQALTTGATMQHIKRKELGVVKGFLPDNDTLSKFDDVASDLLNQVSNISHQNELLSQSRDLLLSRLISGKLLVDNLDIRFPPSMMAAEEPVHA